MWYHFQFKSGANPYVCFNEKVMEAKIKYWKSKGFKVDKIEPGFYVVDDREAVYNDKERW